MNILRQNFAPISDKAWEEINEQAKLVFQTSLTARKFLDVDGPKGWDFGAVTKGKLVIPEEQSGNIKYGIHQIQPLIELRIPFKLDIWELDNVERGNEDIDLGPLEDAAMEIAKFEENAIYYGFEAAAIPGLKNSSEHKTLTMPKDMTDFPELISEAVSTLQASAVEGPYSLIIGKDKWKELASYVKGYPLKKQVKDLLGGSIIMTPSIEEAYVISDRGGDFKLTLGKDLSIGYETHDKESVQLYFTESFTFEVLDSAAYVVLE